MLPVVYHPRYQDYFFGPEHPFRPVRYAMVLDLLREMGHAPALAEPAPAPRAALRSVHDEALVVHVEAASEGRTPPGQQRFGVGPGDTPAFEGMDAATRHVAGGTLCAARMVASGEAGRVLQLGGGLHHAHAGRASGFCVYNDLAVAIRALLDAGLRVAYIDIDVHHGDGVQSIFYDDPGVLTISLHESGRYLFPGTGFPGEIGAGGGAGFKLNAPLEPGTSDESYLDVFERVVPHALSWFGPDVLVVQCGADAHALDPLAHLGLTSRAYETLFRRLVELSDAHTEGRAVFTLGGGYSLDATPRLWTLLYLVLAEEPLPEALPAAWRARWEERLGASLTPTLHDALGAFSSTTEKTVFEQNEATSRALMNRAAKHWR